ncbi:hypothetical protein Pla110_11540 [Polystyrenella longa]|uniref:Uncharacterized protein n=1 Tax=Polystyrenella longa TaxID=2528007 RepID=A0A518CJU3_9PLAN|nr:hypothetical protein [Polystyrenella longa]QDU79444.1 hypothetical protein Pla110_11540 [Polystyrenella longa]
MLPNFPVDDDGSDPFEAEESSPEFANPDAANPAGQDEERESGTIPGDAPQELRLYVHEPDSWQAVVKQGFEKEYCYSKRPGEDYFHLLMSGEIYVHKGNEKYCLTCAFSQGVLSHDRMHWQHRKRS